MPDNVLFEGGAGETIRRRLLHNFDFHTLVRLPTGIFYKQGVKANVLFFDKKRVSAEPNTKDFWIYDLRTNQRFTLKERPMTRADLDDFVACYKSGRRHERAETDRFRRFAHAELIARDKVNLDIFWLKDDTLDDPDLLPTPDEIAAEIVENLEAALDRFRKVAPSLQPASGLSGFRSDCTARRPPHPSLSPRPGGRGLRRVGEAQPSLTRSWVRGVRPDRKLL